MIDIEKIKPEIIKRLKPLNPAKIILFGSYAYGNPTEDSDIDLFLLKDDLKLSELRDFDKEVGRKMIDFILDYKIGVDILSAPTREIYKREDHFYKVDILQNGKVWYAK